jgi:heme-degrading monooxygenase HmoA
MVPFALLAMAIHRIPLAFNKKCSFWKLMGCGRNGTFNLSPDWQQWALLAVWKCKEDFENSSFIQAWWNMFTYEKWTIFADPIASHGKWDNKEPFGRPAGKNPGNEPIGVLTRATIRLNKLRGFWSNVQPVANLMASSPGYITSVGIGEAPFFRQATFSIWEDLESMKAFAYGSKEHSEVIRKTRQEDWYSEELFARFQIISSEGSLNGVSPPVYPTTKLPADRQATNKQQPT